MNKFELVALIRAHLAAFDTLVSETMLAAGFKHAAIHLELMGKYLDELSKL